jgi:hypothetical protein
MRAAISGLIVFVIHHPGSIQFIRAGTANKLDNTYRTVRKLLSATLLSYFNKVPY